MPRPRRRRRRGRKIDCGALRLVGTPHSRRVHCGVPRRSALRRCSQRAGIRLLCDIMRRGGVALRVAVRDMVTGRARGRRREIPGTFTLPRCLCRLCVWLTSICVVERCHWVPHLCRHPYRLLDVFNGRHRMIDDLGALVLLWLKTTHLRSSGGYVIVSV